MITSRGPVARLSLLGAPGSSHGSGGGVAPDGFRDQNANLREQALTSTFLPARRLTPVELR